MTILTREPAERARGARSGPGPAETPRAPHLRAARDLAGVMRTFVVALLPATLFGLYNAGARANEALASLGLERAPGWRGRLIAALGLEGAHASLAGDLVLGALYFLPLFAVTLAAGAAWERLFARARRRRPDPGLALVALLFVLGLPPSLAPWQAALGMSFGLVVGRELFGGTGRNVIHPVLVGLAFLYFSYPAELRGEHVWVAVEGATARAPIALAAAGGLGALAEHGYSWSRTFLGLVPGPFGATSALACLAGAALLLAARVASWRVMLGVLTGASATALLLRASAPAGLPLAALPLHWHAVLGSFAFGTVFLATDPVSSAATDAGRWITGLLIGGMSVLVRVANPLHPDGVLLALLFGNVAAPLVDHGVIAVHVWRRRRRLARAA